MDRIQEKLSGVNPLDVQLSDRGKDVVAPRDRQCRRGGDPKTARVDQDSEHVLWDMDLWACQRGITRDLSRTGKPTDNAFNKAFNGRPLVERPNAHLFAKLAFTAEKAGGLA